METLMRDLKIGLRRLVREPGFSVIVVITLGLDSGATTTIFSVVEGVLLRPLPYRDAERLLTVWQWSKSKGIEEAPSPANFLDWRNAVQRVDLAAAEPYGMDLTGSGDSAALDTWRVSERFFETLGVVPLVGRTCLPEEHVAGRERDGSAVYRRRSAAAQSRRRADGPRDVRDARLFPGDRNAAGRGSPSQRSGHADFSASRRRQRNDGAADLARRERDRQAHLVASELRGRGNA
jgi:hypothetical protein